MKKYVLFISMILIFFSFRPAVFSENPGRFDSVWNFENSLYKIQLFYNADQREAILRFSLNNNTDNYHFSYRLSGLNKDHPGLLIKRQNKYIPFENLNVQLNPQKREKEIFLKFKEDLFFDSGNYSIEFRPLENPGINPNINLELFHPELAKIVIHKKDIRFNINSGPGRYSIDKPFKVEVIANYSPWCLKAFSTPLYLQEEINDSGIGSYKIDNYIPINRIYISLDEKAPVPFEEGGVVIKSKSENKNDTFSINLFIDSSWDDKAGIYSDGSISFHLK